MLGLGECGEVQRMSRESWSSTGWFLESKGSRDLFATIGSIGGFSSTANIAWRGHSSLDYPLTSSLQRNHQLSDEEALRSKERQIIAEAREWGLGFQSSGWSSDLQLLADLQHFGTSTRLLDVTNNPMTALWFACQPPVDDAASQDGLLLALNTAGWQRYGRAMPSGSYSALEKPFSWELETALAEGEPFIVESLVPNDRLRAQEGFFVSSRVPSHLEQAGPFKSLTLEYGPMTSTELKSRLTNRAVPGRTSSERLPFVAVAIPARFKFRILQRLENSYNRRASVLFPDFSGFREFGLEAEPRVLTSTDKKPLR
jgi:hypothetical protein